MPIGAFGKPAGEWCRHCAPGKGCGFYENRPDECRIFECGFLTMTGMTEEWRPSKSKIVLVGELGGARIAAHVDPGSPGAWRREPYYSQLKQWARQAASQRMQVIVCVGRHCYVILPDRDVDLGIVADDEIVLTVVEPTPAGARLDAVKIRKDDPRAAALNQPA